MAEYIDRQAVIVRICEDRRPLGFAMLFEHLRGTPAADVAPVVHGQWDAEGDGYANGEIVIDVWYCSKCGYCIDDGTDNPDCLPKYCPACGAKMDGGADHA